MVAPRHIDNRTVGKNAGQREDSLPVLRISHNAPQTLLFHRQGLLWDAFEHGTVNRLSHPQLRLEMAPP
jgi:hypothetical protein